MEIISEKDLKAAEKAANVSRQSYQQLIDKFHFQQNELPRLVEKAVKFVKAGYSEAYIQAQMYASRSYNVGIKEIVYAIEQAKQK